MNSIIHNPYRVLGVFANSSKREMVANKGKMAAFARVGKEVALPTDFNALCGAHPNRSAEAVAQAESKIALPADQLRYALFWFVSATPMDAIAFNHLREDDIEKAVAVWEKVVNASSLQNRAVVSLLRGAYREAFGALQELYSRHIEEFCSMMGYTAPITTEELQTHFVEVLRTESGVDLVELCDAVEGEWKTRLQEQLTAPLIERVRKDIHKAENIDREDAQAQKRAGHSLEDDTLPLLEKIERIVGSHHIQYTKLADDLGLQILQCGINYFNHTDDDNDIANAKAIQRVASYVVVGQAARERVQENLNILQKIEQKRPPKAIKEELERIVSKLAEYSLKKEEETPRFPGIRPTYTHIVKDFLKDVQPDLALINKKVGSSNSHYIKLSDACVAFALNTTIESVNNAQHNTSDVFQIQNDSLYDGIGSSRLLELFLIPILKKAWSAMRQLESFHMLSDMREHYKKNNNLLQEICTQFRISTFSESPVQKPKPKPEPKPAPVAKPKPTPATTHTASKSKKTEPEREGCLEKTLKIIIQIIMNIIT